MCLSLIVHFGVHLYFPSLANGSLRFFKVQVLWATKFFSLSLMPFGGRIGHSCNGCFVGDFALLKVVRVGVIEPPCVFVWTTILDLSHSQPIAELVLGPIQPSVDFSSASKTLVNHSLSNGLISPRVFCICYFHWFYPPSEQQTRSCFLPCRSLQFSLVPERTHSSCVSQVFPFLFRKKTLRMVDDLVGSLHF